MKKGSSYDSLELAVRNILQTAMTYYQVDGKNERFVRILERAVNDVKEGKPLHISGTIY